MLLESAVTSMETGQVLFAEGDVAESAYFILCGNIEVYLDRDTAITLAELGRGRIIGEQALLPGGSGRRSASARVLESGAVLEIPLATFRQRILSYDFEPPRSGTDRHRAAL